MRIFIMFASLAIESQAAAIDAVQSRTICVSLTKSSPVSSTTYIALKNVTHFSRSAKKESEGKSKRFYKKSDRGRVTYCRWKSFRRAGLP
uniref:Putative secreted protein n=1 Tax=Anopheles triannulatus TaxID=58253 RepID=A0A2M4B553_9DIPT